MPTLSIIIPTRNRLDRWLDGGLLADLRAQDGPGLELLIAVDHSEDDTIEYLARLFTSRPLPYPCALLDVTAPRPEPFPASAVPDNCLIHAARGDVLLHLDDDLRVGTGLCEYVRQLPAGATTWLRCDFPDVGQEDSRLARALRAGAARDPLGLTRLCPSEFRAWGAAWVAPSALLRQIGGHDVRTAGYHNSDTRLGYRLALAGASYFSADVRGAVTHAGETWHQRTRREDPAKLVAFRRPPRGPIYANGGTAFWSSAFFAGAYSRHDIA